MYTKDLTKYPKETNKYLTVFVHYNLVFNVRLKPHANCVFCERGLLKLSIKIKAESIIL